MLPLTVDDLRLFLHVLAASVWVGGQFALAGLVPALRKAGAEVPRVAARAYARVAWPAFAVLVATGIWNVAEEHQALDNSSDYRNTLIVKLVFVVLSGVSAYAHQRATSRRALALGGAGGALFALAAMLCGIVLSHG
ncbi:MAG TPA: CopD family protein [Mycobacteriales bacterium]|nr:CopD family protein [Mycobacteriales bacterium]